MFALVLGWKEGGGGWGREREERGVGLHALTGVWKGGWGVH